MVAVDCLEFVQVFGGVHGLAWAHRRRLRHFIRLDHYIYIAILFLHLLDDTMVGIVGELLLFSDFSGDTVKEVGVVADPAD